MEKLISTLITIAIILFALKWIAKLLLPSLLKLLAKKIIRNAGPNTNNHNTTTNNTNNTPPRPSHPDDILHPKRHDGQTLSDILGGEYINYQEIK